MSRPPRAHEHAVVTGNGLWNFPVDLVRYNWPTVGSLHHVEALVVLLDSAEQQ